jgi:hypothetical protein
MKRQIEVEQSVFVLRCRSRATKLTLSTTSPYPDRRHASGQGFPLQWADCEERSASYSLGKFGSMAYGFNSMSIWIKNKGTEVVGVVLRT